MDFCPAKRGTGSNETLACAAALCCIGPGWTGGSGHRRSRSRKAVSRSQDLYRLDTVGSQIESDLEFQIQESRRSFLYALAVTDPNQQLPYVDEARQADAEVRDTIRRFPAT